MVNFEALLESSIRVHYLTKTEQAYTAHFAAQAKTKGLKRWVNQWKKLTKRRGATKPTGPGKNSEQDFLKRFGKGF